MFRFVFTMRLLDLIDRIAWWAIPLGLLAIVGAVYLADFRHADRIAVSAIVLACALGIFVVARRTFLAVRLVAFLRTETLKFQGGWNQLSCEKDGKKEPVDQPGQEPTVTFRGFTFAVTLKDGSTPIQGTYKLDPTQQPKAVDFTDTFGEDAGKTSLGIYSFEGDRLFLCTASAGQDRPMEFNSGQGQVLRVCQRKQQSDNEGV